MDNYLAENFVTLTVTATGFVGFCFGVFYRLKRNIEKTEETHALVKEFIGLHHNTHDKVIVIQAKVERNIKDIERLKMRASQ